jgi:hypothetical protein
MAAALAALPLVAQPQATAPARPGLRHIYVDAPSGTMNLIIANDDRTNAILCDPDVLTGTNGRITIFSRNEALPLTGRASSVARDLVFVNDRAYVVAVFPAVPPNVTSGGAPRLRSAGVFARYLIELPPAETARLNVRPGIHLRLPRNLNVAAPAETPVPCVRTIR